MDAASLGIITAMTVSQTPDSETSSATRTKRLEVHVEGPETCGHQG